MGGIVITHPDKVWWPDEKITKMDVAEYYAAVSPRILPWLKGHPLTAERCPDGMRGECFFQKDFLADLPPGVPTRPILAESTKKTVHYVIGGSKKTLLALVNLGCIAMHGMNCRVGDLDRPEWLAFDLDPPAGGFRETVRAARILRTVLDELKLRSFPKTSGGKGLHVLIPLKRGPGQDEVREFAHGVAKETALRAPDLVTVRVAIKERRGRVFADWLRNAFGQTIAAPYSARRRPKAPISTPLHWDEVEPGLDPSSFNLRTIERRLGTRDPWADFGSARQTLPKLD